MTQELVHEYFQSCLPCKTELNLGGYVLAVEYKSSRIKIPQDIEITILQLSYASTQSVTVQRRIW